MSHFQMKSGDDQRISLKNDHYQERQEFKFQNKQEKDRKITITFVILFLALLTYSFFKVNNKPIASQANNISTSKSSSSNIKMSQPKTFFDPNSKTPKILWVLTFNELEGQRMINSLSAKHLIHIGKKSNFDVRIVNSLNAYDWLSPQMTELVRKTKHTSKYILSVHQLLRIALLIEHGGLSVKLPKLIFIQNLTWIYDLFEQNLDKLIKDQQKYEIQYCNNKKQPQIMLFYDKKKDHKIYQDSIIYARKNSNLLKETLLQMSQIHIQGTWQLKYLLNIEKTDSTVNVNYFTDMFIQLINFRQLYWYTGQSFCQNYQVISIDKKRGPFMIKIQNEATIKSQFLIDKQLFFSKYGQKYIVQANIAVLQFQINQILTRQSFGIAHQNSIFRSDLMETQPNKWMLNPINKTRQVNFCILSLKALKLENYTNLITKHLQNVKQQTYHNWKLFYFVNQLKFQSKDWKDTKNIKIINSSQYEGLNLQRSATKYCQRNDIAVILNYDQTFGNREDLKNIAEVMRNRNNYGVVLSIKNNQIIIKPKYIQSNVRRKVQQANISLLQQVSQNFRVFSIYSYLHIPHMSLHDNYGRYYDRQIALLTLLQMGWDYKNCDQGQMLYHTKKVEQKIQIPKYRITLLNTFINIPNFKFINISNYQYFTKYASRTLCNGMNMYLDRKSRTLQDFFILNNGNQFIGFQDRKNKPQILQKRIHQMWVGGQMPNFKKFLTNKNKQNHPDYQYFLWTNQNITKQNFPVSYDLIQNLLEFNKISKYNKLSMVSDLMRAEIIYNYGGIYIDTNYLIFREHGLDDWLTYKGMFITQIYPFHRFQREGTVFAAMKGFDRVKRLVDHRAISTRNHYSNQAHIEAGPTFFTRTVLAEEELDPDILQPSFEHLYPYYPWEESNYKNLCEADASITNQNILFKNKLSYRKDCQSLYPWAVGMDFWSQGKTWA